MASIVRRGFLVLIALGLGLVTRSAWAQDDAISARMRKDITYLASDELEGRGVGTKGLDKAADYIAAQFAKSGLKPGGVNGTYFQPFPFATGAQLDGVSTVTLQGPQGQKILLKQRVDFQVLGNSAAGKFSVPLVFAGYGVAARDPDYDDYAGVDVAGKAVVVLRRLPRWNSKELPFGGPNRDALAALVSKQSRAEEHKAAAVILVNDATELPKDAFADFGITQGTSRTKTPFVQIKRAVFDDILRTSTGMSLADTEKAIDSDLKPRSTVLKGWTVALDVKVKRKEYLVKNVIGVLEGTGPLANETVVVGAHYDHLGYGGFGSRAKAGQTNEIHHGADDNGSGTTAVMELTRRFGAMKNRQGRRLVFMAFTAEERGLIGSRYYTREAPLFPLKSTSAMFNLDMVGRLKDDPKGEKKPKLLVEGIDTAKEFDSVVKKLNTGFDVVPDKSVFGASDHFSFYQEKIPVLFFWTGTHEDYHRPTDTSDKINVSGMKRITDFAERIIDYLRTEPKRPEYVYVPSTFSGGRGGGPKLGIMPAYDANVTGVKIDDVPLGGPADQAGMKKGDVIIAIAGQSIADMGGYMAVMGKQKRGVAIDIKIMRAGKELQLKATPR